MSRQPRNPARSRGLKLGWRDVLVFFLLCLPMLLAGRPARADQLVWQCAIDTRSYYVVCDATQPLALPQLAAGAGFDGAIAMDGVPVDAVPASLVAVNYPEAPSSRWTFPLYTLPHDMERVQLLARSLMCHKVPDCQVILHEPR
ncbi:MAG TPA: hypothetical protein VLC55_14480 [Burkholderiales bacterium]|nr:hypothetical protein [Burkholderiales bacterium]